MFFLGGGRITSALCAGLRLADYKGKIVVYDRNPDKMRALRKESQVLAAHDLKSALKGAEVLIVAVRPASVAKTMRDPRPSIGASPPYPDFAARSGLSRQASRIRTRTLAP